MHSVLIKRVNSVNKLAGSASPVEVLESLSLLHVGVEWEGLHVQHLQQSSQSLQAVYAVDKDQSAAGVEQQKVVEIHVLGEIQKCSRGRKMQSTLMYMYELGNKIE